MRVCLCPLRCSASICEQAGLHGRGAAEPPQGAGQPKHELAFDGGLGIVVGDDGGFEGLVVLGIFQGADHGLCSEPDPPGSAGELP